MIGFLGGILVMLGTPIAFIVSLVGLFTDRPKTYAAIGLVVSGVMCAVIFGLPFLSALSC